MVRRFRRLTGDELDAAKVWDGRVPDGDVAPQPGFRCWADLLGEKTELLPVVDEPVVRPYLLRWLRWFR